MGDRENKREQESASRRKVLASMAARARRAGLRVERSPHSQTRYIWSGLLALRISDHELGYADYGSRAQVHHGPEVVVELGDSIAAVMAEAVGQTRECAAGLSDKFDRRHAANMLCALRLMRSRLR